MQKTFKMTKTLANGYSSDRTRQELSNEYQHDRVLKVLKNVCILVPLMKEASALEGLNGLSVISNILEKSLFPHLRLLICRVMHMLLFAD